MDRILVLQNRHWEGKPYPDLIRRRLLETMIKKMPLNSIQVLLGIRRSGKSTLFRLLINHLMQNVDPREILFLNFDDPFFTDILNDSRNLYELADKAEAITGIKPQYLFLDEVQQVNAWEKFVKSSFDNNYFRKIFVTGSNSGLLKSEYASLLSGRYTINNVYPLSFNEILEAEGIIGSYSQLNKRAKLTRLLNDYMNYGGFPEIFKTTDKELKREILLNYFDTILIKDCIAYKNIRELKLFRNLAYYLLSTCTLPYTYNSLGRNINSNENTVKEFISVMSDSYLLSEIYQFSFSLKNQLRSKKKVYCTDTGLVNAVSFAFSDNKGRLFENLVFCELFKNGISEIYFHADENECDFIVKYGKELIAVQSCYELNNTNKLRELAGLEAAMHKNKASKGLIVTAKGETYADNGVIVTDILGLMASIK